MKTAKEQRLPRARLLESYPGRSLEYKTNPMQSELGLLETGDIHDVDFYRMLPNRVSGVCIALLAIFIFTYINPATAAMKITINQIDEFEAIICTQRVGGLITTLRANYGTNGTNLFVIQIDDDGTIVRTKILSNFPRDLQVRAAVFKPEGIELLASYPKNKNSISDEVLFLKLRDNGSLRLKKSIGNFKLLSSIVMQAADDSNTLVGICYQGNSRLDLLRLDSQGARLWVWKLKDHRIENELATRAIAVTSDNKSYTQLCVISQAKDDGPHAAQIYEISDLGKTVTHRVFAQRTSGFSNPAWLLSDSSEFLLTSGQNETFGTGSTVYAIRGHLPCETQSITAERSTELVELNPRAFWVEQGSGIITISDIEREKGKSIRYIPFLVKSKPWTERVHFPFCTYSAIDFEVWSEISTCNNLIGHFSYVLIPGLRPRCVIAMSPSRTFKLSARHLEQFTRDIERELEESQNRIGDSLFIHATDELIAGTGGSWMAEYCKIPVLIAQKQYSRALMLIRKCQQKAVLPRHTAMLRLYHSLCVLSTSG